jgi:uncharacterized membrane protein YgcG
MQSKFLLLALSVAAFSSCSTAYKTGQTPDDVYYSPVKPVEERKYTQREDDRRRVNTDYEITMSIRDQRWRNFRDEYDFDYSPYNYCYCNCNSYGFYYNPYYYPWAIYTPIPTFKAPVNTTPRMVNLNAYNGYNTKVASGKSNNTLIFSGPTQYNNSNRSSSRLGNILRQTIEPSSGSSRSNNSRTYSPSSGSSSGSSSSGSSGGGSGSVSRPGRGG